MQECGRRNPPIDLKIHPGMVSGHMYIRPPVHLRCMSLQRQVVLHKEELTLTTCIGLFWPWAMEANRLWFYEVMWSYAIKDDEEHWRYSNE